MRGRCLFTMSRKNRSAKFVSFTPTPPLLNKQSVVWSPDDKWLAFTTYAPENRSYVNVSVASINGGAARPVSFLANSNASSISWSADGAFILFDIRAHGKRAIGGIDLKLRTPKFAKILSAIFSNRKIRRTKRRRKIRRHQHRHLRRQFRRRRKLRQILKLRLRRHRRRI